MNIQANLPDPLTLVALAAQTLHTLCREMGNRSTGSIGNKAATDWLAEQFVASGLCVDTPEFPCLDWRQGKAFVHLPEGAVVLQPSPFSPPAALLGRLTAAATVDELESGNFRGQILLLHGAIAAEPLFPRNFPFYFPDEHHRIYEAIDTASPQAIITATPFSPATAGAIYPCPLFEDGNFVIPSAYTTDDVGERLAACAGQEVRLFIDSERMMRTACNVIGRVKEYAVKSDQRIVVCAHIDAKPTTPGALDNAAGVAVLRLLAELFRTAPPSLPVELVAFNGEDYYSAPGQVQYMNSLIAGFDGIRLVINIDGAGYIRGQTAYSFYGVDEKTAANAGAAFAACPGTAKGEQWYQGDHTMFVQQGCPAIAITSGGFDELLSRIIHTADDVPELVDPERLTHIALAVHGICRE